MNKKWMYICGWLVIGILFGFSADAQTQKMAPIKGGGYIPLYGSKDSMVTVSDFNIDIYPVTNAEFLDFVREEEKWQKGNVIQLYAEEGYLSHWEGPLKLGKINPEAPVTNVSWWAAKAYCEWKGDRLPTVDEWEYVAMANEMSRDARERKEYNQYLLSWYEAGKTYQNSIGTGMKNIWGVNDLHGLVWEWTYDFSSVLLSTESRQGGNTDNNLFCGAASMGATDLMDYAAFMRFAFRSSMKARYVTRNLGFRCASDSEKTVQ